MPDLKMEYVTVLKKPETHVNIGEQFDTERNKRSCWSRVLSRFRVRRNRFYGVLLLVLIFILYLSELTLHLQSERQNKEISEQKQNSRDLKLVMEILLQHFSGSNGDLQSAKEMLLQQIDNDIKTGTQKSRVERTVNTQIPHFYLEGRQGGNSDTEVTDQGIFTWKPPASRSFNRNTDVFHATVNSGSLKKVQIIKAGMYFVFAKVTANGRNHHTSNVKPPVGIRLMKNSDMLEEAWVTQDERGKPYSQIRTPRNDPDEYPFDTLTIFGLHRLEANDEIYIQRPADSPSNELERFLRGNSRQKFGAFLVEGCLNC